MNVEQAADQMQALAMDHAKGGDAVDLDADASSADDELDDMDDDMDSEELRQDLRAYGIQQLLPLEVRGLNSQTLQPRAHRTAGPSEHHGFCLETVPLSCCK